MKKFSIMEIKKGQKEIICLSKLLDRNSKNIKGNGGGNMTKYNYDYTEKEMELFNLKQKLKELSE